MKERPILFSAPMVRAILDGRKTVTRRIVRERLGAYSDGTFVVLDADGDPIDVELRCPYGAPGDRLWVREGFAPVDSTGHKCAARDAHFVVLRDGAQVYRDGVVFAALPEYARGAFDGITWRPSIHMPRWASRITLGVVSVRAERLHEIDGEDVRREGLAIDDRLRAGLARKCFAGVWDHINGARAPWASNPWVWRVAFERLA